MQKTPLADITDTIHTTASEFGYYHDVHFPLATIIAPGKPEATPTNEAVKRYLSLKHLIPWQNISHNGIPEAFGAHELARRAILEARHGFVTGKSQSISDLTQFSLPGDEDHAEFRQETRECHQLYSGALSSGRLVVHVPFPLQDNRIVLGYCTDSATKSDLLFKFLKTAISERIEFFKSTGKLR